MKKAVGLVIITKEANAYSALLQKRTADDSYPCCLQVSCHGKLEGTELEDSDGFRRALLRELAEELGEAFIKACQNDIKLRIVSHVRDDKKEIITYVAFVPKERLLMIQPGSEVGGLIYISKSEVNQIIPMTPEMKENGAPSGKMAMFPDEIEAVKKAFEIIELEQMM